MKKIMIMLGVLIEQFLAQALMEEYIKQKLEVFLELCVQADMTVQKSELKILIFLNGIMEKCLMKNIAKNILIFG